MSTLASSLQNPAVLFFVLGLLAVAAKSDLDVPKPLARVLALYLLMAIGLRGGFELRHGGVDTGVATNLAASVAMAVAIPLAMFVFLRRRLDAPDAAALSASYGSVSAVTFATAASFLTVLGVPFGGHMAAALALMESPAIVVGLLLARREGEDSGGGVALLPRIRKALCNGSVLLILGSLAVGVATGERGEKALKPFVGDLFQGALCLFLLDMGMVAGRRLPALRTMGRWLAVFGIAAPLANAAVALAVAYALGMRAGDAFLFCVLCASASYIAVPAAMRLALPAANPGIYLTLAIALTFPFNILLGLPLYYAAVRHFWP